MKWINDLELEAIIQQRGTFLIAFLDWSSVPCDHFKPEFVGLDPLLKEVILFMIVAEENPSSCEMHGIIAVPTAVLWRDGHKIGHWEGPYSKEALKERVTDALAKKGGP